MSTVIPIANGNPQGEFSIPLIRFIPNKLATNVGNMRIMEIEVNIFMTLLMLLLIRFA